MKRKKWIYIIVSLFFLLFIGASLTYKWPDYQTQRHHALEKKLLREALKNLTTLKKAVEQYFKQPHNSPESDILLQKILELSKLNLKHGQWDNLGVYTSSNFIYIGGCYSEWCYVEANRKDASYNLYMQYDGKKWVYKRCSTELTELGRVICTHLKTKGWEYVEGEK